MSLGNQNRSPGNRLELGMKIVAIVGGIISALGLIMTLHASTKQNETELMWKKSNLAMELINSMLSDPQAMDAMRMIDWNGRDFNVGEGVNERICRIHVKWALNPKNDDKLAKKDIYIREAIDRLFYHMGRMERSLKTGLINLEDVSSPLTYYVGQIRSCHSNQYVTYMDHLHHQDAKELLKRFPPFPCESKNMDLECPPKGASR